MSREEKTIMMPVSFTISRKTGEVIAAEYAPVLERDYNTFIDQLIRIGKAVEEHEKQIKKEA